MSDRLALDPNLRVRAVTAPTTAWTVRILSSIADLDRAGWDRLYGDSCRGFDFCRMCEQLTDSAFEIGAIAILEGDRLIAGGPMFSTKVPVDMLLEGKARTVVHAIGKRWPKIGIVPLMGLGSPFIEGISIGFDALLGAEDRGRAVQLMLAALEEHAAATGMGVLLGKDVSALERPVMDRAFVEAGYAPLAAPPLTSLQVPVSDDAYIQSLSANMRSNMRRKLKKAKDLRLEIRTTVDDKLEDELHRMRSETIARAKIDFDVFGQVPKSFYRTTLEKMPGKSFLRLYWLGERLIGFTLVLKSAKEVSEMYTGMHYPDGPDHGLFYDNWMEHLREARALGQTLVDTGPTTYLIKNRLGCRFHRSWVYVRVRNRFFNWLLAKFAPQLGLDRSDPDLIELGDTAHYAD
ncbi:MAG: GNAT family N-acetyltransferase [Proteobacteria bacterium]|nr:GNAT family N-acetyltransferase [Pseudomonadota bacterium]